MDTEKTFRTKTGYCHILPDKIVLTRDGIIGNMSKVTVGSSIARILVIYGVIALIFLVLAFNSYNNGQIVICVFYAAAALYLFYGISTSVNNSAAPVIERNKIKSVTFKKAMPGLTRGYFEILFDDNGKVRKRLIMLPGSLSGGAEETEKALLIMTDKNLLSNTE